MTFVIIGGNKQCAFVTRKILKTTSKIFNIPKCTILIQFLVQYLNLGVKFLNFFFDQPKLIPKFEQEPSRPDPSRPDPYSNPISQLKLNGLSSNFQGRPGQINEQGWG